MLLSSKKINTKFETVSFKLLDVSEKLISLHDISKRNGIVLAFICNHCPYVKDIISRIVNDFDILQSLDVGVAAIMPNDTEQYPEDSYEKMKEFALENKFSFPYLYDKEQTIANTYQAVCTPDFFGFNKSKLFYRGRLDNLKFQERNKNREPSLINAFNQMLKNNSIVENQISSIGCSIKWKR
ncbi:thioredoxin family protein [Alphaproteobacteria bacterium]|nr:thioredoxin family protein [Alphaproteobacteria bacterium]